MTTRYPVKTTLPRVANLQPIINMTSGSGSFVDKNGVARTFTFGGQLTGNDPFLTIKVDDRIIASFKPWPSPHQNSWSASGIVVQDQGKGIAKNIYAVARDILAPHGIRIAPSDNLFGDGKQLWASLDPGIKMEERPDMQGYYRPKL